jgi:hypothetical protein
LAIERLTGPQGLPANGESLYYDEIHPVVLAKGYVRAEVSTRIVTSMGRHHPVEDSDELRWFELRLPTVI